METPNLKPETAFSPAWWLPGPHLQTVWGRLARSRRLVALRREVLETPDGDELVLDHLAGERPPGTPRVLLLHGLEGSSYSVYVQGFLAQAAARGWHATALNFRSCARDPADLSRMLPNRRPRLYHSGETSDLDFVVRTLSAREPGAPLCAIGVSLGGNVLLKWLGENPAQTCGGLRGGRLDSVRPRRERPIPRDVARTALRGQFPRDAQDEGGRGLAPVSGGRGADGHSARSRLPFLLGVRRRGQRAAPRVHGRRRLLRAGELARLPVAKVATPALCLSAADDPFLPPEALERARSAPASAIDFRVTRRGGHIGWVAGSGPWGPSYWAEESVIAWLGGRLSAARS